MPREPLLPTIGTPPVPPPAQGTLRGAACFPGRRRPETNTRGSLLAGDARVCRQKKTSASALWTAAPAILSLVQASTAIITAAALMTAVIGVPGPSSISWMDCQVVEETISRSCASIVTRAFTVPWSMPTITPES